MAASHSDLIFPGKIVKVHLPGEAPWAIVKTIMDGKLVATISNHTVCHSMHGYLCGDIATFIFRRGGWELAPLGDQP